MSEQLNQFSHLPLRLTNEGTATPSPGGAKKPLQQRWLIKVM